MQSKYILVFIFLMTTSVSFAEDEISRGRYLTLLGGCNDCHTSGFAPNNGNIPENEWLKGDSIGWRGPWGTTYPKNLRNLASALSREQWISFMKNSQAKPPMPTYVTRNLKEEDLGAIHSFIKSLGAAGSEVPSPLPPGVEPTTPYFNFEPVLPKK